MTIFTLWIALVLLGAGYAVIRTENETRATSTRTVGRVVGHALRHRRNQRQPFYHAVVEFRGLDGRVRYLESQLGANSPLGAVGQERGVFLRRDDDQVATIESPISFAIAAALILGGLGVLAKFFADCHYNGFSILGYAAVTAILGRSIWTRHRRRKPNVNFWQLVKTKHWQSRLYLDNELSEIPWAKAPVLGSPQAPSAAATSPRPPTSQVPQMPHHDAQTPSASSRPPKHPLFPPTPSPQKLPPFSTARSSREVSTRSSSPVLLILGVGGLCSSAYVFERWGSTPVGEPLVLAMATLGCLFLGLGLRSLRAKREQGLSYKSAPISVRHDKGA